MLNSQYWDCETLESSWQISQFDSVEENAGFCINCKIDIFINKIKYCRQVNGMVKLKSLFDMIEKSDVVYHLVFSRFDQ
jgi:hypothetical protein